MAPRNVLIDTDDILHTEIIISSPPVVGEEIMISAKTCFITYD